MTRPTVTIHDVSTDETIVREMNDAEFAEWEQRVSEQKAESAALAAKETAKEAAQAKLAALGLTTDDLKALGL
jgi:hypothetical protein